MDAVDTGVRQARGTEPPADQADLATDVHRLAQEVDVVDRDAELLALAQRGSNPERHHRRIPLGQRVGHTFNRVQVPRWISGLATRGGFTDRAAIGCGR